MTDFWKTKRLDEMTPAEWESLCDGCGQCCLIQYEEDDGSRFTTQVACRLLDLGCGHCRDYRNRAFYVSDCAVLTPEVVREGWLPPTCAYRLVEEGKPLYWWHPLISGDPDTVRAAGVSVVGKIKLTEDAFTDEAEIEKLAIPKGFFCR